MLKYEMLKKVLRDIGMADVKTDIGRAIRVNALIAPYLNRGHQALRARDLDTALYEFERATIIAKNHWYPYKHVAEVRLLKGSDEDLSGAIANCKEAIRLNPGYASAHCLLADCLFLKGKFQDAIIHFESALRIAPERADFHARYAIALSTMSDADFSQAIQNLLHKPEKFAYSLKDKTPLALALDHLDRAHEYSVAQAISTHRPQLQDAEYFFGRGVAFLQAYLLAPEASKDAKDLKSKAQEQFKLARRYDANSHHILHGYGMAHGIRRNL